MEEEYIKIFGPMHFTYIGILILFTYLLFRKRQVIYKNRKKIDLYLIGIILFQQIIMYKTYFNINGYDFSDGLPLHACRVSSILLLIFLINKNEKIAHLQAYFASFALLSFIYPSRIDTITHPMGLSFIINHIYNLLGGSYTYFAYHLDHSVKIYKKQAYILFLAYISVVLIINPILDGNYFYLKDRPFGEMFPESLYIPITIIFIYILFSLTEKYYKFLKGKYPI